MASSNAVTLFSSVVLGIAVYGELSASGGGHVASAVGPAVAIVGIVLLGSAEDPPPPTSNLMIPSSIPAT